MSKLLALKYIIIFIFLFLKISFGFAQNSNNYVIIYPSDTQKDIIRKAAELKPSPRQLRWQELELTAFIHFGINTFTNKEWGEGSESPSIFNPKKLNADQWVKVCKKVGFKQIIITAKHHDGFCLWPSKFTEHSVKNSPWKNGKGDVVKAVADACKKYQIGFGIYLSPWDRNSKYYGTEEYNKFFVNQLTELLTEYGKVDEVWFDGANGEGPNGKKQEYEFETWYNIIRKLQPSATISIMGPDIRWVGTESGYGRETEWSVMPLNDKLLENIAENSQKEVNFAPMGDMAESDLASREKIYQAKGLIWYPSETDVSIRPGWFYHPEEDNRVKSVEKLFDIYCSSVGRNSVLLMNIPPNKNGLIANIDTKILEQWRKLIDKSFSNNLLKKAAVSCNNGLNMNALVDDLPNSYFTTKNKDTTCIIEFKLNKKEKFDAFILQENIRIGQRIEAFELESWEDNHWQPIGKGTTVGYKRIIRFSTVTSDKFRVKIVSSRLNPTLSNIGLYKLPKNVAYQPSISTKLKPFLQNNIALHKAYSFQKVPHLKYNQVEKSGLTNGIIGGDNAFNDGQWCGWSGEDCEVILDLNGFQTINNLRLVYFNLPPSWIFPPSEIEILCSANGIDFDKVSSINKFNIKAEGAQFVDFKLQKMDCKFIKLIVKNFGIIPESYQGAGNPAWLFLDEIIIN